MKILDFGLAKLGRRSIRTLLETRARRTPPRPDAGVVLGTVGYMSPEQVRGDPADPRSDIFAFGVGALRDALGRGGRSRATTAAEVMTAILREDPPELARKRRRSSWARARGEALPGEAARGALPVGAGHRLRPGGRLGGLVRSSCGKRPSSGEEKAERTHGGSRGRRRRRARGGLLLGPPARDRAAAPVVQAAHVPARRRPHVALRPGRPHDRLWRRVGRETHPGVRHARGRPGIEPARRARGHRRVCLLRGRAGDADRPHVPARDASAHPGPRPPCRRCAARRGPERPRGRLGS